MTTTCNDPKGRSTLSVWVVPLSTFLFGVLFSVLWNIFVESNQSAGNSNYSVQQCNELIAELQLIEAEENLLPSDRRQFSEIDLKLAIEDLKSQRDTLVVRECTPKSLKEKVVDSISKLIIKARNGVEE